MIKEILTYDIESNDNPPILRQKLQEVTDFNDEKTISCIQDLNDTLDDLIEKEGNKRGAIGLSSCQIGYDLAISAVTLGTTRYVFINPKLLEENGKRRLFRIGCFSLYKYRAMVYYNDDVLIGYEDENGNQKTLRLQGDQSCVVQHEMDHLNGDLLFERLEHKEKDLFVPREANKTFVSGEDFETKRKLGLNEILSTPVYYSSLFNDYTDYVKFCEKEKEENKEFLELIRNKTPENGTIAGICDDSGALSILLAKEGFKVTCIQSDGDMLELSKAIAAQNKVSLSYLQSSFIDLSSFNESFDTIFSAHILERLEDEKLLDLLKQGTRFSKKLIFLVPTIEYEGDTLRGDEHLRSISEWEALLKDAGFNIETLKPIDEGRSALISIS